MFPRQLGPMCVKICTSVDASSLPLTAVFACALALPRARYYTGSELEPKKEQPRPKKVPVHLNDDDRFFRAINCAVKQLIICLLTLEVRPGNPSHTI